MTRYFAGCLVFAALSVVPGTGAADPVPGNLPAVYDTVDAVEVWGSLIFVTGIISGQSTPSEIVYTIFDGTTTSSVAASRCDRLALLVIAKPGKYQFAITRSAFTLNRFGCKLITRNP